jgi:hypothetical protein
MLGNVTIRTDSSGFLGNRKRKKKKKKKKELKLKNSQFSVIFLKPQRTGNFHEKT